ncbi:hypothetical protein SDC9_190651 [bioreactor metagenome]|uniref:Uncharacterized protein n=1 Tax=bioreactor metagenome TaxID=1076179 RepID=A0A645HX76_9ZZZZ
MTGRAVMLPISLSSVVSLVQAAFSAVLIPVRLQVGSALLNSSQVVRALAGAVLGSVLQMGADTLPVLLRVRSMTTRLPAWPGSKAGPVTLVLLLGFVTSSTKYPLPPAPRVPTRRVRQSGV